MARRAQSVGGVDEVPMVIDGGKKGLAQSMHHPNAGQGAFTTASRTNPDPPADRDQLEEHVREAYRHIASLVHGETFQGVWEAIQKLLRADREAHAPRGQTSDKLTTTKTELSATVREAVEAAMGGKTMKKTWAEIAAGAQTARLHPAPAEKPVPARFDRELVVRGSGITQDLRQRRPPEIVQAVNRAFGATVAIAARVLRSGDTVITFEKDAKQYRMRTDWLRDAFGPQATLSQGGYTLIVKGVPIKALQDRDNETATKAIAAENKVEVIRLRARRAKGAGATKTTLILTVDGVNAANKICDQGLLLQSELFNSEPYDDSLDPKQCFRCYQMGHLARYCEAKPTCGRCGTDPHPDNECPAALGQSPHKCPLCGGAHPAWDRRCNKTKEHWDRARKAYAFRARRFESRGRDPTPRPRPPELDKPADDSLLPPHPKRPRPASAGPGRPSTKTARVRGQSALSASTLALRAPHAADVIAIQEPAKNAKTGHPICPSRSSYRLVFTAGRAALYVHKRHDTGSWTSDGGVDWCSVTFTKPNITIFSIYSPIYAREPNKSPLPALASCTPCCRAAFVGDFNIHHPLWDIHNRTSDNCDDILGLASRWNLALATPEGEITRLGGPDHIPQLLQLDATARFRPSIAPSTPQSPKEIDDYADWLVNQLTEIAYRAAPKVCGRADGGREEWWTRDVENATRAAKQAERLYLRTRNPAHWEARRDAVAAQNRATKGIWALERWARLRSTQPPAPLRLPDLSRVEGDPTPARTRADKTRVLAERFFPTPSAAHPDATGGPAREPVTISNHFSLVEVEQVIKRTAPWKAAGEDAALSGISQSAFAAQTWWLSPNPTRPRLNLT
ncbi:uncharacterized protein HRG_10909 [Hirsutella rhossiliensis]|uniref:CCHC-type domain-containing protein n=1 Tax=Hirsutella rhossiliensis TaxID=111463 RepID=A0A9P8SEA0_9HYPO|nr:uncharacterized protein HRG_10909 [Hirsutella rhossiliensis]KAH0957816.1 hypothetical protein HRG_10909 [Hirsutella rhossiliensis]